MAKMNKFVGIMFFQVIELAEDDSYNFSVRFMEKSGSKYVFGEQEDVGLISTGPPDFYEWERVDVAIDHRGHYSFV